MPILPYALAFAAVHQSFIIISCWANLFNQGAMVYVVVDDIIPEAQSQGNGRAASWGAVVRYQVE